MEYFIDNINFTDFVKKLLESSRVLAPVEQYERNYIQEVTVDNIQSINLFGFRTVEPFKSCFFAIDEIVSKYFGPQSSPAAEKLTILGARGCDLEALEVSDRVFGEGEYQDPFYLKRRENSFIIGADCTGCGQTCFCTLVRGKPWPLQRFDLSLAPIEGGFIVEVGTDKGKKFVEENHSLFSESAEAGQTAKAENRKKVLQLLAQVNGQYQYKREIAESHKRNLENQAWKVLTKDCVECSSCNLICPTCTCFLLTDSGGQGEFSRHKVWDACLKSAYQKVAGGSNPRGKLYQRLQNRYHCKMDYSFDRLGRYTCVGCGRCIDGCAGNIDMRKIFAELERQAPLTAKLV
ncbi:MAG: 4Fe-4S dicluster domain-containing protein [Candidatus Margulisbacteria bacterium]|nr:4Fe-4S dicluster domain-containing protein [Candidatus Margulisiibacteriota bacterium]